MVKFEVEGLFGVIKSGISAQLDFGKPKVFCRRTGIFNGKHSILHPFLLAVYGNTFGSVYSDYRQFPVIVTVRVISRLVRRFRPGSLGISVSGVFLSWGIISRIFLLSVVIGSFLRIRRQDRI